MSRTRARAGRRELHLQLELGKAIPGEYGELLFYVEIKPNQQTIGSEGI